MKKFIFTTLVIFSLFSSLFSQGKIRRSAIAGSWYPAEPRKLKAFLKGFFDENTRVPVKGEIRGIISPHAGYFYSGNAAAAVYKQIEGRNYDIVVIIAPSHHEAFRGSSIYPGDAYETPFGKVYIDKDIAKKIVETGKTVKFSEKGHLYMGIPREHSLEIQLPLLQMVIKKFKIIPIIMGEQNLKNCKDLADAIARSIKGKKFLIVASSDLSHYHNYNEALKLDGALLSAFEKFDYIKIMKNIESRKWEACGGGPIVTAMITCERFGAKRAQVIKYYNSGDLKGSGKSSVVGYAGGIIF
ncbi:AmmeMemoRadiSam system protein B [candidate division KSB1 bacterium]|nr:MAG: AmmeMemoRadiSam system protein B [candidate division KSB1 bacterium]